MRGSHFLVERPRRARQSIRRGWQTTGSRTERARLATTLGYFHVLSAVNRVATVEPPIKAMGLTLHFGSYDQFVHTFDEVFAKGSYAITLPNPRPTIVDCGANLGLSVLYFKHRFPDATIVAFEPEEANYALLNKNIIANALTDLTCHRIALGGEDGSAVFHTEPSKTGSVMGTVGAPSARPHLTATQTVPVKRLSSYLETPVDLLKLDIEGSEGAVLSDLAKSGKLGFVNRMIVEYHHHLGVDQLSLAETLTLIEGAGFDFQIATPDHSIAVEQAYFEDVLIYAYRETSQA